MSVLFQVLSVIVLFQLIFISFFLLTNRKGRRLSNYLLAAFFLSLASGLLDFVLLNLDVFDTYHQYAFLLNSLVLLHSPLLLLYVRSITRQDFELRPSHLIHLWAFVLALGLLVPFYYTKNDEIQQYVIEGVQRGDAAVFIVISLFGLFYELGYLAAVKWELHQYGMRIRERFSNLESINLKWMNYMVNVFMVSFTMSTIASFIRHTSMEHLDEVAVILGLIGFLIFINSVLLKGLHQNEIFLGAPQRPIVSSRLQEKNKALSQLQEHLANEQPYLNPNLTLEQLADQLSLPARDLSTLINTELGQSFFDLINSLRVEEAKRLIENPNDPNTTILEVMYAVGFNSKSSFNTAFKKYTGTTPTAFKSKK